MHKNIVWILPCLMLWFATPAAAQITFPGSIWESAGTLTPAEPHNPSLLSHLEQGIAYRGAELYLLSTLGADRKGYDWNNRLQGGAGIRFTQSLLGGAARIAGVWIRERRWITERPHDGFGIIVDSYFSWGHGTVIGSPPISPVLVTIPPGGQR